MANDALQNAASKYVNVLQDIKDEFASRYQSNTKIRSLLAKIHSGKGTYEDASEASRLLGSELSEIYTAKMKDAYGVNMPADTAEIDSVLRQTLKHDYDTITELSNTTQKGLNKAAGINMNAVVPNYNENRAEGIITRVDEFSRRDPDAALNELRNNIVNYSMSVVDDSVKANAEAQFRSGFVPKITRKMQGFHPCKWCQALAGTYEYPDVPDDVYRRHQNCYCTVTYTPAGSKRSQDVWSKKWGKEKEFQKEKRKKAIKSSKSSEQSRRNRNTNYSVNWQIVNSQEYRKKFEIEGINQETQQTIYNKAKDILKHRDGTDYEDLYLIDSQSGKVVGSQTKTEYAVSDEFNTHFGIVYNDDVKRAIKNNKSGSLIALHNHPTGTPPSGSDFNSIIDHNYRCGVIAGNDGSVYLYSTSEKEKFGYLFDMEVDKNKKYGYTEIEAYEKALQDLKNMIAFDWRKL